MKKRWAEITGILLWPLLCLTALEGMARQPEVADTLRTNMILGCAITESTGIYSLVIALLLLFVF